jgi:hypothetical protein
MTGNLARSIFSAVAFATASLSDTGFSVKNRYLLIDGYLDRSARTVGGVHQPNRVPASLVQHLPIVCERLCATRQRCPFFRL